MPPNGYTKRQARWSKEEMIEACHAWVEAYGDIPAATDWAPYDSQSHAKRSAERAAAWERRAARFYDGIYPWTGSVWKQFGGWNAFIQEAGYTPRQAPRKLEVNELSIQDTKMLADLAKKLDDLEGHQLRAGLHELASAALTLAMDTEEEA